MVANAEQDIPLPQLKRQLVGAFYLAFWEIMTNPLYNKSTANSSAQATLDKPFFPKTHEDMDTFVNAIKTGIRRVTSYNTFRYRKLFPNSPVVVRLQKINKKLDQYTPPHYFHQFSGEDAAKIHVAITKNKQIIRFYSQDLHLYLYLSCAYPLNQSNTVFSGASIEPKDHNLFALIDEIFLIEEFLSELHNAALSRPIEQLKAIIGQIIQIDTTVLRLFFPELCAIHLCGGMINYAEDSGDNLNIKIATGDPWADIHINKLRIISSPPTGLTCEDLLTQEELNDESEEELKNNPNKTPALAPLLKILLCAF